MSNPALDPARDELAQASAFAPWIGYVCIIGLSIIIICFLWINVIAWLEQRKNEGIMTAKCIVIAFLFMLVTLKAVDIKIAHHTQDITFDDRMLDSKIDRNQQATSATMFNQRMELLEDMEFVVALFKIDVDDLKADINNMQSDIDRLERKPTVTFGR